MMISLSHPLNSVTPCYGGKKESLSIEPLSSIRDGATSNSLKISMTNHVGTHMDFPRHFHENGPTLSDYSAHDLVFSSPCWVDLSCDPEHMISISDLEGKISRESDFILIRTGFEKYRQQDLYWKNNPGFLPEVGFWLREEFEYIRGVGFDFISLTCFQKRELGREAHRAFLSPYQNYSPILIVEDMKLKTVKPPLKKLILAPLLIENADGAPVTALAEI